MPQSKNSCAIFASPGGGKRRDVYSVGKPSSTCTLMEPGVKPRRIISNFCSHGEESAYLPRSPWMCAPHRRFDLARKEFCVGRSLSSRPQGTFLAPTLHAPRTPYRHRTQDKPNRLSMERFPLENLDKFVVLGQNARFKMLQSLFPHFPIVAPQPSCSLTSDEHELPVVP